MRYTSTRGALLRAKLSSSALTCGAGLALLAAGAAQAQEALPVGGVVTSGSATIARTPDTVTVAQSSSRAIVGWTSFDVAADKKVVFVQPDAGSATLNRVTGTTRSTIAGQISANGSVYLVNPNGIAITATGTVRTGGGFVASTLDIADADFNAGRLKFTGGGGSRRVSNAGTISAGTGAYVALLGGSIVNSGTISVPLGKVALGSGERLTLDLNGDGFLQVALPSDVAGTLINSSGQISAAGGRIELRAATARDAVRNVVNMSGTISADSAIGDGGTILLMGGDGGTVRASGTLTARATGATGKGGFIETSGATVDYSGLKVDTSAAGGTTGMWLIDPTDLLVDAAAAATISGNLATSNVTLETMADGASGPGTQSPGNGDILINSAISWTSANMLTLRAYHDIAINASITGSIGGLTLIAGDGVPFTGTVTATGAVDVGLFDLANGQWTQNAAALPAFRATDFRLSLFNGTSFLRAIAGDGSTEAPFRITDVYGLQGMASVSLLGSNFALANSIDASGTGRWNDGQGFLAIGTNGDGDSWGAFHGTLDGGGFVIRGLTINRSSSYQGLFGLSYGTIKNVGLVGGSISGLFNTGGLVGYQSGGTLSNVYSTASVRGYSSIGGLVGVVVDGSISNAYASGPVNGSWYVGGLVGAATDASISNAYASGSVEGNVYAAGLVGMQSGGSISNVYASGPVGGGNLVGGLVGYQAGTVSNAYWDSYSTGQASAFGDAIGGTATAVTSDPTQSGAANYAYRASAYADLAGATGLGTANVSGFVFMPGDSTRPFLAFEVPVAGNPGVNTNAAGQVLLTNAHQLQLVGYNGTTLAGTYTLANSIDLGETGAVVAGNPATYAGMWARTGFVSIGTDGEGNYSSGFRGTLDGSGFAILGLTISRGTAYQGLFGISHGTIKNVGLVGGSIAGRVATGGLVGYQSGGTLSNVYSTASVSGDDHIGGLVGFVDDVSISNAYASGSVNGNRYVGGLVGSAEYSSIGNAYASGSVQGNAYVGGLVGKQSEGSIRNVYASGPVRGRTWIGGLVGSQLGAVSSAYWDSYSTGRATAFGDTSGSATAVTSDPRQSGAANYAYKASAYANLAGATGLGTANVSGFVFLAGDSTRPFLAFEVPVASNPGVATNAAGQVLLTNAHQLQLVGYNGTTLAGNYALANAIDLGETGAVMAGRPSSYAGMWAATGFVSIGSDGQGNLWNGSQFNSFGDGFAGHVDGSGFTIANLTINRASDYQGLFGAIFGSSTISNLALTGGSVQGRDHVGGLIGFQSAATVTNVSTTGSVDGNNFVGGLIGLQNYATLDTGFASGPVTGATAVGGLIGFQNRGTVSDARATGPVVGLRAVGGLIGGIEAGTLMDSYATGSVSGANDVGGLVGTLYLSEINNIYATGSVIGTTNVGGLSGVQEGGAISGAYATGSVNGNEMIGGLVGYKAGGTIDHAYATGAVTALDSNVGGLVGYHLSGSLNKVFATGTVTGGDAAGGLVGLQETGDVSDAYATGAVAGGSRVGGLVGYQRSGTAINVYATGHVTGVTRVGGLIGANDTGSIRNVYATGSVRGSDQTGGLIGSHQYGDLAYAYATGSVSGGSSTGGLIGLQEGASTTNVYASGSVSGDVRSTGGLVGTAVAVPIFNPVSNAYWDIYSTGQAEAFGNRTPGSTVSAVTSDPTQSGAANYAYKASAYGNLGGATGLGTATVSGFVFLAGDSTRPFLAFEVPVAGNPGVNTNAAGQVLLTNAHQLQLVGYNGTTLAGDYALANAIDLGETDAVVAGNPASYAGMWAGTGFVSIGTDGLGNVWNGSGYQLLAAIPAGSVRGFSGTFDGQGYTLSGLTIRRGTAKNIGLFGLASGAIANVTVGGSVTGFNGVGGLVGQLYGTGSVINSASLASVSGNNMIGGLVGNAANGSSIAGSSASGDVDGVNNIGGLIGYASGATISNSWASGSVNGTNYVGGLIGYQYLSSLSDSYATGRVVAIDNSAGGLVGTLYGGSIVNSLAANAVSAARRAGGLTGQVVGGGTVINSEWNAPL